MDKDETLSQARQQSAEAKDEFLEADKGGTDALQRHDYTALSQAVEAEADAIKKHRAAIERLAKILHKSKESR